MFSAHLPGTVVGTVRIWATAVGIRRVDFESGPDLARHGEVISTDAPPPHLLDALRELRSYFAGGLREFSVPLDIAHVTPFQKSVYDRLLEVPFGQVVSYGRITADIGSDPLAASRAVGQAVGANPVAILIPCHRVVGSDGSLGGFMGGLERKAALLSLEGIHVEGTLPTSRVRPEVLRLPL